MQTFGTDPIATFQPSHEEVTPANDLAAAQALAAPKLGELAITYSTSERNYVHENFLIPKFFLRWAKRPAWGIID